jgi:hypothetical protein
MRRTATGRARALVGCLCVVTLLQAAVARGEESPPASVGEVRRGAATFSDGSSVPGGEVLAARLLGLELVGEQLRMSFPPRYQEALGFVLAHIERMADLLAGAAEHPQDDAALRRAVAVGVDLAAFALDVLAAERRPGLGLGRQERLEFALSWCWQGMRALREDPLWVDHQPAEVRRIHLQAWHFHDENLSGEERSVWGQAGVQAAVIASGAAGLAELVGLLPRVWLATQAGLGRLAAALGAMLPEGPGGGGVLWATEAGAIRMSVLGAGGVRAGALVGAIELSEAEILQLVQLGRLSPVALQLHLAARVDEPGGRTPAQQARAQNLSGSNSVAGKTPPGFRSSQKWDATRNADVLKANLAKQGVKRGQGEDVHHVVPSTHRKAEPAREILDRFGIDINAAENGVFLKATEHHGKGLHSDVGIDAVARRLRQAEETGSREEILDALRRMGVQIKAGTFPPSRGAR